MSLTSGQKLGPYEIIAPAGAGGMGEIYKAKDTRLDRVVAIKVLPTRTAQSADMRSRFDREAKAISSLNHPNICTLHDIGHQDGVDYLVMEYIDGDTLASRLTKGPLSSAELFTVASQIADALDKAHKQGLVHRDLKPGNIMLTKSGAKLLDFGLAKLQQVGGIIEGGSGATRTSPLTGEGTLIGTVQYMSPEQLEGKEADARSDIFAFGATLYEMATGKRAFEGSSQASLIGAIMKEEPKPISAIQPMTPPALELVVKQCLAKDPDNRWQSAGDLNRALQWVSQSGSQMGMAMPVAVSLSRKMRQWAGWAVAAVAVMVAVALYMYSEDRTSLSVLRTTISAPEEAVFLFGGDNAGPPVISPDGKHIAFVAVSPGGSKVWVRDLDNLKARSLPGTEAGAFPFWSPDGRSIGFFTYNKLKRIEVASGQVLTVCAAPSGRGGTWGVGDNIVFSPRYQDNLYIVPASGGTPVQITTVDSLRHSSHRWPLFLPDGQHILFFAGDHDAPDSSCNEIWFVSLDGTKAHAVMSGLSNAVYAKGYLMYVRDNVLFAQAFDAQEGRLTGDPIPTQERVQCDQTTWKSNLSVSQSGLLVYQLAGGREGCQLLFLDRAGKVVKKLGPTCNIHNIYFARDGRGAAYTIQETPTGDIYYYDLERDMQRRLTFGSEDQDNPVLSPSGDAVAFTEITNFSGKVSLEIRTMPISGAGRSVRISADGTTDAWLMDWSMDGKYLLCGSGSFSAEGAADLFIRSISNTSDTIQIPFGQGLVSSARFSPDGKWIALSSIFEGKIHVFVVPSPIATNDTRAARRSNSAGSSARWQITTSGGSYPRWRSDGKELYYIRTDGTAMAVDVNAQGTEFKVGQETELFRAVLALSFNCWDPTPDGQHFLASVLAGEGSTPIVVVQNWTEELMK
ncbi:MAG: protein kinase [Candidatus Zixiibacteriota bacterium]